MFQYAQAAFISGLITCSALLAQLAQAQPFPTGAETLFLGHSFFRPVAQHLDQIVDASGAYPDHSLTIVSNGGKKGVPGSLWQDQHNRNRAT